MDAFWDRTERVRNCILWTGALDKDGYGKLNRLGRTWQAHRYVWTMLRGEIPADRVVTQTCCNHRCVNVEHLELVNRWIANAAGHGPTAVNLRKTHCKNGHPLEETYPEQDSDVIAPKRKCRICAREVQKRRKRRFGGPKKPRPSKQVLAKLMRDHSFVQIGELHGVTDTTARNWARDYGLHNPKAHCARS